jgi:hypothetical protein
MDVVPEKFPFLSDILFYDNAPVPGINPGRGKNRAPYDGNEGLKLDRGGFRPKKVSSPRMKRDRLILILSLWVPVRDRTRARI